MSLSPTFSTIHLGSFQVHPYTVHLNFNQVKGIHANVSTKGRSIKNVELVAPFSDQKNISSEKLYKLSSSLSSDYSIRISNTVNNLFRVEFQPKRVGGGGQLSCGKVEEEKKAPTEDKDNNPNLSTSSLPSSFSAIGQNDLVREVQRKYLDNIQEVKELLATYIPPSGSSTNAFQDPFSLEEAVIRFLKSDQKILLLLGDSGAGKTTFGKYLTYRLWRE